MQAPSIEKLFAVETAIHDGMISLLTADGITGHRRRGTGLLQGNRCEVLFESGGQTDHLAQDADGRWWRDVWNGTLVFRVVTRRGEAAAHESMLGRIRMRMQLPARKLDSEALFPHHLFTWIEETAAADFVEQEEDHDVTELRFACVVSIRTAAWPAA